MRDSRAAKNRPRRHFWLPRGTGAISVKARDTQVRPVAWCRARPRNGPAMRTRA